ncbi:hypothetical protein [Arthrobacter globiformis]|uniref:DNA-binding protein n=1 Tax=Arthrobacter globiformis TaxID=1665 RepID=A0A328HGL6_ARTGO|nr:hypothetical protein [Arthrobacter globiformis]RAM37632.1 hypothetical protein DBZ45_08440 [Arthrobacter globiformis]
MVDAGGPQDQAVPIRGLPERGRVLCRGFIESVTYAPPSQVAAFMAIVSDHDTPVAERRGRLRVIWLGRRRIPGIDAGTELKLEGMLTVKEGMPTMFNPRYEILSRQENQ